MQRHTFSFEKNCQLSIILYLCRQISTKLIIMHASDSIVIIPTYNEKENIEKIIRAVFGLEKCFHILVIDDGSPDGTAAIVKGMMAQEEFSDRLLQVGLGNGLYHGL